MSFPCSWRCNSSSVSFSSATKSGAKARNSSNSKRLVEVASDYGARSYLIDNAGELEEHWLDGVRTLGITSGASAPEELVQELVALFRDRGVSDISEVTVTREDVRFMLPKTIRTVGAAQ